MKKLTFLKPLLGNLTELHQTMNEASVDPPDKKQSKAFWSKDAQNIKQQISALSFISSPNTFRLPQHFH